MNIHSGFLRALCMLAGVALQLPVSALSGAQTPPPPLAEVRVEKVVLSSIGQDSIEASVRISAAAKTSATLRGLTFEDATINGVPVRVPPVAGPIRLRAGEEIDGLPDLSTVLMYRELESFEPLRRAVRDGDAHVHATVRAQLDLNLFEKLALRAGGAWATLVVDQDVPLSLPGGMLGRVGALAALTAAEPAWVANQGAREWIRNQTALAKQVGAAMRGHLVSIETRYELKSRDGQTVTVRVPSAGFLIGRGEVVAPAEAVEPWSFDSSIAQALDKGEVSLNPSDTEILATLLSDDSSPMTFSSRRKEIRIRKSPGGDETAISADTRRPYHLRFRDRDSNAALLEIPGLKDRSGLELANGSPAGDWQPAAVVRLNRETGAQPSLWLTEARWENGRYRIKDPTDDAALGSPLWIDGGVAGMLQDANSAAGLSNLMKKLR